MSKMRVILSDAYQKQLSEIEDFIWESSGKNIHALETFFLAHDHVLEFLKSNPHTAAPHPLTGDLSWPFGDGRYRLFFIVNGEDINLLDLIDNRMSNLRIYPNNSLPSYHED